MRGRRPARRDLAARRRQGQPDRPDPGAGQGRAAAAAPGSSSGSGSPASTRPGRPRSTGVRTDRGRRRGRGRRQLRRPVGARPLGDLAGVTVPLHSAEHFYVVTEPGRGRAPGPADPARPGRLDLLQGGGRRPGGRRLRARGQAVGRARRDPVPVRVPAARGGLGPLLGADGRARCTGSRRSRETGIRKFYNGPESFTPGQPVPARARRPELRGFFVGAGFNSVGIASAGGAGRALAEWVVEGEPTIGPGRRSTSAGSRRSTATTGGCATGSAEVLGLHYAVPWPNRELETARPFRCSPLHDRLGRARRVLRLARWAGSGPTSSRPPGEDPALDYTWGKPRWLPWSAAEQRATRSGGGGLRPDVVLASTSSPGRTRSAALQWVCAADVDVPVGPVVYTRAAQRGAAPTSPTSP